MPRADRKLHDGDRRGDAPNGAVVGNNGNMIGKIAHVPTPALRRKVETLAALSMPHEAIGFALDLHAQTIAKYYRTELETGKAKINGKVGAAIAQSALGERDRCPGCNGTGGDDNELCGACGGTGEGDAWVREPSTTAQIWWSKNRMGWTDRERIEHVGDGGGPVITEQISSGDTIKARLEAIRARLSPPANDAAE